MTHRAVVSGIAYLIKLITSADTSVKWKLAASDAPRSFMADIEKIGVNERPYLKFAASYFKFRRKA